MSIRLATASTFSFNALTDLFQALFIFATLSLTAAALGLSTQILCLSMEPIAFPIPDSFTTDLVTGSSIILVSKCKSRSTPPESETEPEIRQKQAMSNV